MTVRAPSWKVWDCVRVCGGTGIGWEGDRGNTQSSRLFSYSTTVCTTLVHAYTCMKYPASRRSAPRRDVFSIENFNDAGLNPASSS